MRLLEQMENSQMFGIPPPRVLMLAYRGPKDHTLAGGRKPDSGSLNSFLINNKIKSPELLEWYIGTYAGSPLFLLFIESAVYICNGRNATQFGHRLS